ncbi:GNAT family N-acetyltransferase [Intestinimonas massiliensis (ex Afouda et al. 2020)]|uniref:GNAT family N-acetyltransferase n=1 Tax=Intestinimonas massiliensis (ex Afouda et al. 2020) TaxID=1673721 RepID=UPI00102F8383|nr:GNAT family N-acetyltransferase [Intestinimonas massiliensis (ex Afouda et al. 2020)]
MAGELKVRPYGAEDLPAMTEIWNQVVEDGVAFPQEETLDGAGAAAFFAGQSRAAVAELDGEVVGLYILHPNNVGRCGHIANASYGVRRDKRGRGVGRVLVEDSLAACGALGFRLLQFNAVVASNLGAIALYESLGFVRLGTIPGGFRLQNGGYEDIIVFYHTV